MKLGEQRVKIVLAPDNKGILPCYLMLNRQFSVIS